MTQPTPERYACMFRGDPIEGYDSWVEDARQVDAYFAEASYEVDWLNAEAAHDRPTVPTNLALRNQTPDLTHRSVDLSSQHRSCSAGRTRPERAVGATWFVVGPAGFGRSERRRSAPGVGQHAGVTFFVNRRLGESIVEPPAELLDAVLAELDGPVDDEHSEVSLTHESEWCLTAFASGLVVWENVEDMGGPRHMHGVARPEVRRLWALLSMGYLDEIERQPWLPGYG